MQSVLSRNWTRITVSISCDDNHYTTVKSGDAQIGITNDNNELEFKFPAIYLMSRVFANDLGDRVSNLGRVIPKTKKIVLDAS